MADEAQDDVLDVLDADLLQILEHGHGVLGLLDGDRVCGVPWSVSCRERPYVEVHLDITATSSGSWNEKRQCFLREFCRTIQTYRTGIEDHSEEDVDHDEADEEREHDVVQHSEVARRVPQRRHVVLA